MQRSITPRRLKRQLRRWCPIAESYQDAGDSICGMNDCLPDRSQHKLRLRLMIICPECEQGCFNRADFDSHECYSSY